MYKILQCGYKQVVIRWHTFYSEWYTLTVVKQNLLMCFFGYRQLFSKSTNSTKSFSLSPNQSNLLQLKVKGRLLIDGQQPHLRYSMVSIATTCILYNMCTIQCIIIVYQQYFIATYKGTHMASVCTENWLNTLKLFEFILQCAFSFQFQYSFTLILMYVPSHVTQQAFLNSFLAFFRLVYSHSTVHIFSLMLYNMISSHIVASFVLYCVGTWVSEEW